MERVDGWAKVTGQTRYAADLEEPCAIAVPLAAAVGRCRVSLDTEAGLCLPSVIAILTHQNAPRLRKASSIGGSELGEFLPLRDDWR